MQEVKISKLVMDMVDENCYIVYKNERAIIVDPGAGFSKIQKELNRLLVVPEAIILTHAHFDHIASVDECRKYYNIPVYVSPKENEWLTSSTLNLAKAFGLKQEIKTKKAEFEFENYKEYTLADITFKVLPTPGHSPGGVSFDFGKFVIVGDAIFMSGYGRCDLPGSDFKSLKNSHHKVLFKLNGEKIVYSGHGQETTIKRERDLNLIDNMK